MTQLEEAEYDAERLAGFLRDFMEIHEKPEKEVWVDNLLTNAYFALAQHGHYFKKYGAPGFRTDATG